MKHPKPDPQQVFLELYEAFSDEIFRFCLGQTRNRDLSLDITQETFVKTWDYLRTGKTIDMGRAFLYKTCRHLIIDHRRKRTFDSLDAILEHDNRPAHEPSDATTVPTGAAIEQEALIRELKNLPEAQYEILMLRYIQELTLSEIAALYGESENTISVRIHRAAKQAQKLFGADHEPYEQ